MSKQATAKRSFIVALNYVLYLCITFNLAITFAKATEQTEPENILQEIEFKDAKLIDAMRIISELSNNNIVVTPAASDAKVTVFLRNIEVKHAIETICRVNDLWYRNDIVTNTFRIMTNEEYAKDLVIHRDEQTKVFTLNNLNVNLAADAIANLYGKRVIRSQSGNSYSADSGTGSSGSQGGNSSNQNGNNQKGNNGNQSGNGGTGGQGGNQLNKNKIEDELSIDQLSALLTKGAGNNVVSANQLQQLADQQEPIYATVVSEHNLVIVRTGDRTALKQIEGLIKKLDRPVPQVLLEMKILDVLVDDNFSSVFNYSLDDVGVQGDSPSPILLGGSALTNSGSFIFEYMNNHLKANIELLQQNKRANVLSTPMILASNNRPSKLFVGEEQVVTTGYETNESTVTNGVVIGGGISPITTIEEIGNTIDVTPFINMLDGTVALNLKQENSSLRSGGGNISIINAQGDVKVLSVDTVNTANVESTIIVKDNHTIAVGGLIRETESDDNSQVPLLGDIPLLGHLFSSKKDKKERSELILLITPRILETPDKADLSTSGAQQNTQLATEQGHFQCGEMCR